MTEPTIAEPYVDLGVPYRMEPGGGTRRYFGVKALGYEGRITYLNGQWSVRFDRGMGIPCRVEFEAHEALDLDWPGNWMTAIRKAIKMLGNDDAEAMQVVNDAAKRALERDAEVRAKLDKRLAGAQWLAEDICSKATEHTLVVTYEYRDRNTNQPIMKRFAWHPTRHYFASDLTRIGAAGAYGMKEPVIEGRYADDV